MMRTSRRSLIFGMSLLLATPSVSLAVAGAANAAETSTSVRSGAVVATPKMGTQPKSQVSAAASWGTKPRTARNPVVPEQCGTNITLVLDASGSIGGNNNNVRNAARSFLDSLKDTGSQGRVLDFATGVRQTAPMSLITGSSLSGGGIHDDALNAYYRNGQKGVPITGRSWHYRGSGNPTSTRRYTGPFNASSNNERQYTNWQAALEESSGQGTELVVFITDGDPSAATSNGKSNQGLDAPPHVPDYLIKLDRNDGQDYSFWKGINAANDLKASGRNPRVLAVGVGKALSNNTSLNRLKAVAGPDVYDGTGSFDINVDDVTTVRDFNRLGESLKKVATELCSPSVTITKLAQTADSAQYVPTQGWDMTVSPSVPSGTYTWTQPDKGDPPGPKTLTTNSNGQAQFQWEPSGSVTSTAQISETVKNGYTFNSASCRRLDDGVPSNDPPFVNGSATFTSKSFDIPVGPEAIVTCEYRNSFDYAPGISLTKRAADDPVRGNANGWDETYTFEVKNTGNAPLNGVAVSDSKCQSISGPTGDTNLDGWLDQSETWTYTCTRKISHPTTDQDITEPNTADVIAVDPNKTLVSATAQVSVSVKTPAIKVDKVATRPDGTLIGPTDEVPA
ncbi:MAG: hypothetical protein K0U64_11405, partial [Actinomycetia bacterium]|nr:hypothetical protein [Actinomycetes bacterium]